MKMVEFFFFFFKGDFNYVHPCDHFCQIISICAIDANTTSYTKQLLHPLPSHCQFIIFKVTIVTAIIMALHLAPSPLCCVISCCHCSTTQFLPALSSPCYKLSIPWTGNMQSALSGYHVVATTIFTTSFWLRHFLSCHHSHH